MFATELVLHGLDLLRRGGGINQDRLFRQPFPGPVERVLRNVAPRRDCHRIEFEGLVVLPHQGNLALRRH